MSNNIYGIISNVRASTVGSIGGLLSLAESMLRIGYLTGEPVTVCTDVAALEEEHGADASPIAQAVADSLDAWRSKKLASHNGEGEAKEPKLSFDLGGDEAVTVEAVQLIAALRAECLTSGEAVTAIVSDGHRRLGAVTLANAVIDACALDRDAIVPETVECSAADWYGIQLTKTTANDHVERIARMDRARLALKAWQDGAIGREADLSRHPYGMNKGRRQDAFAIAKMAHATGEPVEYFDGIARAKLVTLNKEATEKAKNGDDVASFIREGVATLRAESEGRKALSSKDVKECRDGGTSAIFRPVFDAIISGDIANLRKLARLNNAEAQEWAAERFADEASDSNE
jgi:hypothetical protein